MLKFLAVLLFIAFYVAVALLEAFLHRYNQLKDIGWYREDQINKGR